MATKQEKDVRICEGCGEVLQFTDSRKPGYIPEEVYKRNTMNLCRRCFRMQHYSEDNTDFMPSDTLTKILYDAKKKKAVFAYVVDLFNLEATFNDSVNAAIKGSTVILLANKRDVLPKSFKDDDICNYIYKKYKVKPEFLWDTSPDNGVFRNKYNKKWFGIILNVSKNKLDSNYKQEEVEVINIKLNEIMINELLKEKGFFKAYHMNKKSWISIILDSSLDNEIIYSLIDQSYDIVNKK